MSQTESRLGETAPPWRYGSRVAVLSSVTGMSAAIRPEQGARDRLAIVVRESTQERAARLGQRLTGYLDQLPLGSGSDPRTVRAPSKMGQVLHERTRHALAAVARRLSSAPGEGHERAVHAWSSAAWDIAGPAHARDDSASRELLHARHLDAEASHDDARNIDDPAARAGASRIQARYRLRVVRVDRDFAAARRLAFAVERDTRTIVPHRVPRFCRLFSTCSRGRHLSTFGLRPLWAQALLVPFAARVFLVVLTAMITLFVGWVTNG